MVAALLMEEAMHLHSINFLFHTLLCFSPNRMRISGIRSMVMTSQLNTLIEKNYTDQRIPNGLPVESWSATDLLVTGIHGFSCLTNQ